MSITMRQSTNEEMGQMVAPHSERLTALDASFLALETPNAPMHLGALLVFDASSISIDGNLDFDRITNYIGSAVQTCQRYRQRIKRIPVLRHPVWVDDNQFNLQFHVRRASVPAPGSQHALKQLTARILSQHLDRSRPLWEIYIIDGIENNQFALLCKVHHCMVDGMGGMRLLQSLLRPFGSSSIPEQDGWIPRPQPSGTRLLRDELSYRVRHARELLSSVSAKTAKNQIGGVRNAAAHGLAGLKQRSSFTAPDMSPYRRFDWTKIDLDEVKQIRKEFGGTVNDVLVAVTAGAVRRFLRRQGVDVCDLEGFRAVLPVHVGSRRRRAAGNRVAMLLADLPLEASNPRDRMNRVVEVTRRLKEESHEADAAKLIEEIADVTSGTLLSELLKTAMRLQVFDLILTNIPGPQMPLYLLGSKLNSVYPVVPLMPNQNVGIALFSYNGTIFWGINADWKAFPDLPRFVSDLRVSYEALRREARRMSPQVSTPAEATAA